MGTARREWCGLSISPGNLGLVLKGGVIFHWLCWWKWRRLLGAVDEGQKSDGEP